MSETQELKLAFGEIITSDLNSKVVCDVDKGNNIRKSNTKYGIPRKLRTPRVIAEEVIG